MINVFGFEDQKLGGGLEYISAKNECFPKALTRFFHRVAGGPLVHFPPASSSRLNTLQTIVTRDN